MLYNKQIYLHNPENGTYGDCHRTCVANILNLLPEEVPHYYNNDHTPVEAFNKLNKWLESNYGLYQFEVAYNPTSPDEQFEDSVLAQSLKDSYPDIIMILIGKSRTGCNHSVVIKNGIIIHDPSQTDAGIIGVADTGYWHISILAKIF